MGMHYQVNVSSSHVLDNVLYLGYLLCPQRRFERDEPHLTTCLQINDKFCEYSGLLVCSAMRIFSEFEVTFVYIIFIRFEFEVQNLLYILRLKF